MKPHHYLKITPVLLACGLATGVIAQPAGEKPERRSPQQSRPENDGPRGERPFGPPQGGLPFERILNDEQRAQFRESMQGNREKMREIGERQQKLRAEMQDALFADKLDEDGIRKRAAEMAEIDAQRQILQARAFQKVRPSLSKEQLEQMKKVREEMGRMREQRRDQFFEQRREQFEPREKRDKESIGPRPEAGPERPRNPDRPRQDARLREEFRPGRQFASPDFAPREGMPPMRRFDPPRSETRGGFAPRAEGNPQGRRFEYRNNGFDSSRPPSGQEYRRVSPPPRPEMRRTEQRPRSEAGPRERGDQPSPSAPEQP